MPSIILATASEIRQTLLRKADIPFSAVPARIDEVAIKASLMAEDASPRDIADALAEFKARKIADRHPEAMVIGCDQVLEFKGQLLSKPENLDASRSQLTLLRGQQHKLLSAIVIYEKGEPIWRHIGQVRLLMRDLSDVYIDDYVTRNWPGIGDSVGSYKLEEEGSRLFSRIEGDYFTVLGLPLLELIGFLTGRGIIDG